jgi:hypothetical protein
MGIGGKRTLQASYTPPCVVAPLYVSKHTNLSTIAVFTKLFSAIFVDLVLKQAAYQISHQPPL